MLARRRVLLCVTGGVAAYKSAYLARRLIEAGAEVKVILTESAEQFIAPQTFAAITGERPHTDLFGGVSTHTELARWAELAVVAPATAATIGRLATGIASDLLSATLLATRAPILIAPAMHTEMWEHPATRRNMGLLAEYGYAIVGPNEGDLAGGDVGMGRVAEPEEVLEAVLALLGGEGKGRTVLVTAGGTREPVDPVRYVGNRSSGKMGHAIAEEARRRGYQVTLVTTSDLAAAPGTKVISVETAEEMLEAVSGLEVDVAVFAAAVADFRPARRSDTKIPRGEGMDTIGLEPTPDVLAAVVGSGQAGYAVGFAAETGGLQRALAKAAAKGVDLMVYNDVTEPGSGFGTDTNRVAFIGADGSVEELPLLPKREVARRLWDRVAADLGLRG